MPTDRGRIASKASAYHLANAKYAPVGTEYNLPEHHTPTAQLDGQVQVMTEKRQYDQRDLESSAKKKRRLMEAARPPPMHLGLSVPDDFPSSDLLKCIQHEAAMYYSERGMMKQDQTSSLPKRRAIKKSKGRDIATRKNEGESIHENVESSVSDDDSEASVPLLLQGESGRSTEEPHEEKETMPHSHSRVNRPDMNMLMDGSALVSIGIFMQELVAYHTERAVEDALNRMGYRNVDSDEELQDQTSVQEDDGGLSLAPSHIAQETDTRSDG